MIKDSEGTLWDDPAEALSSGSTILYLTDDCTLTESLEIPEGVTFIIPSSSGLSDTEEGNNMENVYTEPSVYVTLIIPEGITLTVSGTLIVSGNQYTTAPVSGGLSGPYGAVSLSGEMEAVSGSVIYARGEIYGSGTLTVRAGGTVYERFLMNDWPGGTIANSVYSTVFPLSFWELSGISAAASFETGSALYAMAYVFAEGYTSSCTPVEIIGDEGLFTQESGTLEITSGSFGVSGDASLGGITLSITASNGSYSRTVTLESRDTCLPVSQDIVINGSLTVPYDTKLLPGAEMTVNGSLQITGDLFFYTFSAYSPLYNGGGIRPLSAAVMSGDGEVTVSGGLYSASAQLVNIEGFAPSGDTASLTEYNLGTGDYDTVTFYKGEAGEYTPEETEGILADSEEAQVLEALGVYYLSGAEALAGGFRVISEGTALTPVKIFYIKSAGWAVYAAETVLSAGCLYSITGTVFPEDAMVYISRSSTGETLELSLVDEVTPSDGCWSYRAAGLGDTLIAWIKTKLSQEAYITMTPAETAESGEDDEEDGTEDGDTPSDGWETEEDSSEDTDDTDDDTDGDTDDDTDSDTDGTDDGTDGSAVYGAYYYKSGLQVRSFYSVQASDSAVEENGYKDVEYTVSGWAPAATGTVYLSAYENVREGLEVLDENIYLTMEQDSEGNFTGTVTDVGIVFPERLFVWCLCSKSYGILTAEITWEGGVCLSGETLITMADYSKRELSSLAPRDMVLSGEGRPVRVLSVKRGLLLAGHTVYTFSDGTEIDETHDHRFYNIDKGFFQLLRLWDTGDRAKRQDGEEPRLLSRRFIPEKKELFGLWTESGDYWANGLLSGETAANRPLLAEASPEKAADMASSLRMKGAEMFI